MEQSVGSISTPHMVRKVRSDKRYNSNAERQAAYRRRKKSLDTYFLQLDEEAEFLDTEGSN